MTAGQLRRTLAASRQLSNSLPVDLDATLHVGCRHVSSGDMAAHDTHIKDKKKAVGELRRETDDVLEVLPVSPSLARNLQLSASCSMR